MQEIPNSFATSYINSWGQRERERERGQKRCCIRMRTCEWLALNPPGVEWKEVIRNYNKAGLFSFFFSLRFMVNADAAAGQPHLLLLLFLLLLYNTVLPLHIYIYIVPILVFNGFWFGAKWERNCGQGTSKVPFFESSTILWFSLKGKGRVGRGTRFYGWFGIRNSNQIELKLVPADEPLLFLQVLIMKFFNFSPIN